MKEDKREYDLSKLADAEQQLASRFPEESVVATEQADDTYQDDEDGYSMEGPSVEGSGGSADGQSQESEGFL